MEAATLFQVLSCLSLNIFVSLLHCLLRGHSKRLDISIFLFLGTFTWQAYVPAVFTVSTLSMFCLQLGEQNFGPMLFLFFSFRLGEI